MGRELNLMHLWTCKILIFWSIYKFCPHFPPQTYSAVSRIPTFAPSPSLFFTISSSLGRKHGNNTGATCAHGMCMFFRRLSFGCSIGLLSPSCPPLSKSGWRRSRTSPGPTLPPGTRLRRAGEGQGAQSKTLCKSIKSIFDLEWWSFKQYQKVIFFKPWSSIDSGPGLQFPKLLHTSPGETVKLKFILKG